MITTKKTDCPVKTITKKRKATAPSRSHSRPLSHPLSKALRSLFEFTPFKHRVGLPLAAATLVIGVFSPSPVIGDYNSPVLEVISLSPATLQLTTTETIRNPVDHIHINQRFSSVHPAVDLQGKAGDPVFPLMKGQVTLVSRERYAYGNHVLIDHGNGLQTLYAHLSRIDVEVGQSVSTDQSIGLLGSTGRSTGPHLHFEVIDQGQKVNPLSLMKI